MQGYINTNTAISVNKNTVSSILNIKIWLGTWNENRGILLIKKSFLTQCKLLILGKLGSQVKTEVYINSKSPILNYLQAIVLYITILVNAQPSFKYRFNPPRHIKGRKQR